VYPIVWLPKIAGGCRWNFSACVHQLALKCYQNNIQFTSLSSYSAKHQQQACIIAGLPPSGQRTLISGRWSVALRPSICPVRTIYSKSECRRNLKLIEHLMKDTSNRFNDCLAGLMVHIRSMIVINVINQSM